MFRKLKANEIDVRIGTCKETGVSLLLYKDARADMSILDETVKPFNWKREHTRDNANCIVSIWDKEKGQWISKEDTGTESFTEKEKGLASDSFKRACVNWGIGRELYTAPFIWVSSDKCNIKNGKCYDRFDVKEIDYDAEGNINTLIITLKGKEVFNLKGKGQGNEPILITPKQIGEIKLIYLNWDSAVLERGLENYGVSDLTELTFAQAEELLTKGRIALANKKEKK